MNSNSPRFSIDGVDVQKVLTGLILGLSGVAITLLTMLMGATYHLTIGNLDFSPMLQIIMPAIYSTIINLLRKYITDHSNIDPTQPLA